MKDVTKTEFQNSLGLGNTGLESFVPQLHQGLWELGSMPEYVIQLVEENIDGRPKKVTDLGCGKGAVLIKLAKKCDISALGIDIVPEFISEAAEYAQKHGVSDSVQFKADDIVRTMPTMRDQDIIIYGYDSGILGDLKTTLHKLSDCITDEGHIILEFMYSNDDKHADEVPTEQQMLKALNESSCRVINRINWDLETLKSVNQENTSTIAQNVEKLKTLHPDKKALFEEFLQDQIDECEELENDYSCITLLLVKN